MAEDADWPPPEARLQAVLWRAEGHLERHEYFAASQTLAEAFDLGETELVRGLHHLAAAGYRRAEGDRLRAGRQLAHARRRLAPFLPKHRGLDLRALLESVERR